MELVVPFLYLSDDYTTFDADITDLNTAAVFWLSHVFITISTAYFRCVSIEKGETSGTLFVITVSLANDLSLFIYNDSFPSADIFKDIARMTILCLLILMIFTSILHFTFVVSTSESGEGCVSSLKYVMGFICSILIINGIIGKSYSLSVVSITITIFEVLIELGDIIATEQETTESTSSIEGSTNSDNA